MMRMPRNKSEKAEERASDKLGDGDEMIAWEIGEKGDGVRKLIESGECRPADLNEDIASGLGGQIGWKRQQMKGRVWDGM